MKLIYPERCPRCGKISDGFCEECQQELQIVRTPYCYLCGKPLHWEEQEYCNDCLKGRHRFEQGRALFCYEGPEKEIIHKIKYENKRAYLSIIAEMMGEYLQEDIIRWNPDCIVPIPMYKTKERKRGFNQAEILARHLALIWNIPLERDLLKKWQDTGEQKTLTASERKKNLIHAFYAEENNFTKVLLVDDVFTTGSTLDAAAEVLMETGIEEVYFVVIGIGLGD